MKSAKLMSGILAAALVAASAVPAFASTEASVAGGSLAPVAAVAGGSEADQPAETQAVVDGASAGSEEEVAYASDGAALPTPDEAAELALAAGEDALVPVYRLYQPASSEHLYTSSYNEAKTLFEKEGWGYEGISWSSPSEGEGVYRLYNPGLGSHLYTTSENERKILTESEGWQYDNNGEPLYQSGSDVPVYRLYNEALGGIHHLTTSKSEYEALATMDWTQEGTSFEAGALLSPRLQAGRYVWKAEKPLPPSRFPRGKSTVGLSLPSDVFRVWGFGGGKFPPTIFPPGAFLR